MKSTSPEVTKNFEYFRSESFWTSDDRFLGDSDYVDGVLRAANEPLERTYHLKAQGLDGDEVAEAVAAPLGLPMEAVWAAGNHRRTVEARRLLCYWSIRQLGVSMSSLTRRLGISTTSVSQSTVRGQELAQKRGCLLPLYNI